MKSWSQTQDEIDSLNEKLKDPFLPEKDRVEISLKMKNLYNSRQHFAGHPKNITPEIEAAKQQQQEAKE